MNIHLFLLLSQAIPITDSQPVSPSIGNDAQDVDLIKAEPSLNGFPGDASLDVAQVLPSTKLPGQPSTEENVCCTKPEDTDKMTCANRT